MTVTDPPTRSPQDRRSGSQAWATADHIGGLIWFVFGAAVFYGSWTMDRLESQGVAPITAPGLLPGLVGIGIMAFALVLLFRKHAPISHGYHAEAEAESDVPTKGAETWKRLALSWALCMGFAGVLLGRGLPFWLIAAGFVFFHVLILDDPDRIAERPLTKRAVTAAIIAIATAAIVTFVFQKIFLVRLP